MLSQRDLPLWARAVAILLLLFASWWLFDTDSIRNIVGDSIGALCLGGIAVSILQGMRLPLGLWPEGPWRSHFSVPAVVGTGAVVAALIALSKIAGVDALAGEIDPGTSIAVVAGSVTLGFGVGFVKQIRSLIWYAIALGIGILPFLFELALGSSSTAGEAAGICYFAVSQGNGVGVPAGCSTAFVPAFVSLTAIGTAAAIVTEEIAFRRLLIGLAPRAGLLPILVSTLTALCWYVILPPPVIGGTAIVVYGTLGALTAGCIYVLSKSLMVSALYSGVLAAGYQGLALATGTTSVASAPAAWIVMSVVALLLVAATARQNGFFGNLKEIS